MKWQFGLLLFCIILLLPIKITAYSERDLWLVEVVVNEDYATGQVVDALVLEKDIFLPVITVANLLQIPVDVDFEAGRLTFERPGDMAAVYINIEGQEILVAGNSLKNSSQIYNIAGDFYLCGENLGRLMDVQVKYDEMNLLFEIQSKHLAKGGEKEEINPFNTNPEETKETIIPFSISQIQYNLTAEWSKREGLSEANLGFNNWSDNTSPQDEEKDVIEEWETKLSLDMKGTIYDWKYDFGSVFSKGNEEDTAAEIDQLLLTYDMDRAFFQLGTLSVKNEEMLVLEDTSYNGVFLGSRVSPLMKSAGNIIQVRGDAETGSTVTLYVNGWKRGVIKVKEDGKYLFRDIILFENKRANELKLVVEKPNGLIEEEYRYIAVSEGIINKGEVNYIGQIGQLSEGQEKPYLLNGIAYWGATQNTTLGMAWYGEIADQTSLFNYNSITINQRINKNNLIKGLLYQIESREVDEKERDMGYKINYDYRDKDTMAGLMYHKEGEQYHVEEDERVEQLEVYKAFFVEDITPECFLEGNLTRYQLIEDPEQQEDVYQLNLKVEKDRWIGMVGVNRNISWKEDIETNTYSGSMTYHLLPELELTNELEYQIQLKDEEEVNQINIGIAGIYDFNESQYTMGVNWDRSIDQDIEQWHYNLGWSRGWDLDKNRYLNTALSYNLTDGDNLNSQKVPINLGYTQTFANDLNLNLDYLGSWEKIDESERIEHKLTLSLEGAFNFFGGKIVSTSPYGIGTQIGIVSGIVYKDSNRNGQYDLGEVALAGIPVKLGTRIQFSGENGEFVFKNITAGTHTLGFDYNQLPIELTPTLPDQKIKVEANGEAKKELGLYVVGTADGVVTINNANLIPDHSLAGVKIMAEPGGYSTITDQSGYYFFDHLPAGQYRISLDMESLPEWAIPGDKKVYEVVITEKGEYFNGIDYLLNVKAEFLEKHRENDTEKIKIDNNNGDKHLQHINLVTKEDDLGKNILTIDLENRKAKYNGTELELKPFVYRDSNGVLWLPLRPIFKAFGAGVYWNGSLKQIHILDKNQKILLDVKYNYTEINGEKVTGQNEIVIKDGFSYLSEKELKKLGFEVGLENNVIYIKKNDTNK